MDWKKLKDWFKKRDELTEKAEQKCMELLDRLDPDSENFIKDATATKNLYKEVQADKNAKTGFKFDLAKTGLTAGVTLIGWQIYKKFFAQATEKECGEDGEPYLTTRDKSIVTGGLMGRWMK